MATPESPVVVGLEALEWEFGGPAAGQPQYAPLPALVSEDGIVTARWALTAEERMLIAAGADVFVSIWTHGKPLPPSTVWIGPKTRDPDEVRTALRPVPRPTIVRPRLQGPPGPPVPPRPEGHKPAG